MIMKLNFLLSNLRNTRKAKEEGILGMTSELIIQTTFFITAGKNQYTFFLLCRILEHNRIREKKYSRYSLLVTCYSLLVMCCHTHRQMCCIVLWYCYSYQNPTINTLTCIGLWDCGKRRWQS